MVNRSLLILSRYRRAAWLLFCLVLLALVLSACKGDGAAASLNPDEQITPTPTKDSLGYQAVAPAACLVADFSSVQTDRQQGNLMAWQPGSHNLAYLAPQLSTSWYAGMLLVAGPPSFLKPQDISGNVLVSGDITWSPKGSRIAFLALRLNEGVQTVMVANANGSGLTDVYPRDTARSDSRTSQKAILRWNDEDNLVTISSCGDDCEQADAYDVRAGTLVMGASKSRKDSGATPAPTRQAVDPKVVDGLQVDTNLKPYDPKLYPRGFSHPNWSPDGKTVLYLDRRGILWLLDPLEKIQYILDVGLRDVYETKWSDDSRMVAVRAEDRIFLFEVPCAASKTQ